jgi:23S rRNA pseudouridine2605 synthase
LLIDRQIAIYRKTMLRRASALLRSRSLLPPLRSLSSGGETMRVSRLIAQRGAMSRRQADVAIAQGRVTVDASPARVGDVASSDAAIVVDGRHVRASGASDPIIWLAYKKRGEAVERERSSGRDGPPSVFSRLNLGRHACAVGRLDVNSEGLLVLTSCGMLARAMEHPDLGGLKRVYDVTVNGFVTPNKIAAMRRGVTVDKVRYQPLTVAIRDARPKRATLTLTCREGKNRMIRRICDHLRLRVSRLRRVGFGPFRVGQLPDQNTVVRVPVPRRLRAFLSGAA